MKPEDFTASAPGRLVTNPEGHWTFVPHPLPPKLELDLEVLNRLSEANLALGQLDGVGQKLPNLHLLTGSFLRREAVLSSRIEGTLASAEELLLFEVAPTEPIKTEDVREVSNYVEALHYGVERLAELPVSLRLIKELHAVLMKDVRGQEKRPGEFRTRQNFIAKPGQSIQDARFVPPAPQQMLKALHDWEKYLHAKNSYPLLIDLALTHYQFEAIHPFLDGNGRIGRLLIPLLLCERKCLSQPLLYLSAYFERNRAEYVNLLLQVSQKGAWTDWLLFFLRGLAEQALDGVLRSRSLLDLRENYRRRMQAARTSALLLQLLDHLFAVPALTVSHAKRTLKVSFPTAQASVNRLVDLGVLVERTGRSRNRIYIAPEIIAIIDAESFRG